MKPIGALRPDAQAQIDLCEGWKGGYQKEIVNSSGLKDDIPSHDEPDPIQWLGLLKEGIVAAIAIVSWIILWHRRRGALHWPISYGTVEFGIASDTDNKWIADLSYSYTAGTEFYSGRIVLPAKNEDDAHEKTRRWKGQVLMVRYSPDRPEISVIRLGDQQSWALSDLKLARVQVR